MHTECQYASCMLISYKTVFYTRQYAESCRIPPAPASAVMPPMDVTKPDNVLCACVASHRCYNLKLLVHA